MSTSTGNNMLHYNRTEYQRAETRKKKQNYQLCHLEAIENKFIKKITAINQL